MIRNIVFDNLKTVCYNNIHKGVVSAQRDEANIMEYIFLALY